MTKLLLGLSICITCLFSICYGNNLPVGIDVNTGYLFQKFYIVNNNHFFLEGNVLFHIIKNFYTRIKIVDVSIYSSDTSVEIATGDFFFGVGTGVDILMFAHYNKFNPYGIGGFVLSTYNGGDTYLGITLGVVLS